MTKTSNNKIKFFTVSILILILSQIFITALTVSSFEEIYLESYASSFNIFEKYFKKKLKMLSVLASNWINFTVLKY